MKDNRDRKEEIRNANFKKYMKNLIMQKMKLKLSIFLIFLLVNVYLAMYAEVLEPIERNVTDGENVYLGKIGPGQTLYITVYGKARTGGKFGKGGTWQILRVVSVPEGWEGYNSKEMATYMQATIKPAKNARDGRYTITMRLEEDETKQQELGSVTFFVTVDVDKNVILYNVLDKEIEVGVGQPARVRITITNTGKASDVVEISSEGLLMPEYLQKKYVYVPAGKEISTYYEFISDEEKRYEPKLKIISKSSDLISHEEILNITVKSNLIGDIKATKNGILLFPSILDTFYSLIAIIGKLVQ